MSDSQKVYDGNTKALLAEVPLAQVPETARFVFFRGGKRVVSRDQADQVEEIVRVVRFTFDREGRLTPADQAFTGFLKHFNRTGVQVKEDFLTYHPDAKLMVPARFGGDGNGTGA